MCGTLGELRQTLIAGLRLSKQGSFQRRAPAREALPYLVRARAGLRQFVVKNGGSAEAWRLLSLAEESLLNYREALECLAKSMSVSGRRDRAALKRLELLKRSVVEWDDLGLLPEQLRQLGEYLGNEGVDDPSMGTSLKLTEQWLYKTGVADVQRVIHALRKRGAYSDFQVLYNVVRG